MECVSPAGTPRGRRRGRDRGPGRGFFDAVPVSASAAGTEALRTSRVVGYAPEDIASRLAASYVILPSKIRLVEDESDDDAVAEVSSSSTSSSTPSSPTRAVSVATRWTTTTGGATIWISGSYLRAARGAFGCAVDGVAGTFVAASSAVAACVSPGGLSPGGISPVVAFRYSNDASSNARQTLVERAAFSNDDAPTVSVTRPAWAIAASPGAAPSSGGITLVVVASRIFVPGESTSRFGCVVGVVGPILGRPVADDDGNDGDAARAVACVSPAGRPAGGRRPPIPVAFVGESRLATASPPTIRVVDVAPGDVPGALVAIPGTVPATDPAATDPAATDASTIGRVAVTLLGLGTAYPAAATFAEGGDGASGATARCASSAGFERARRSVLTERSRRRVASFPPPHRAGSASRASSGCLIASRISAPISARVPRFAARRRPRRRACTPRRRARTASSSRTSQVRISTRKICGASWTASRWTPSLSRRRRRGASFRAEEEVSAEEARARVRRRAPSRRRRSHDDRSNDDRSNDRRDRRDDDHDDHDDHDDARRRDGRATFSRFVEIVAGRSGGVSPRVVSSVGGVVVRLAGANLRSANGGACSCWFGTLGPVAAACGPGWARCASPAAAPAPIRFRYLGAAVGSDAWWRDDESAHLDVALGVGGVASAIPSAVETTARAVAEGARVAFAGWGAANGNGRRRSSSNGARDDDDDASCAFTTSPRTPTARGFARVEGWIECAFASTPSPGFHVVSVTTRFGRDDDAKNLGVGFGAEIEIREGPELRVASPARTPSGGGGVLWITGSNLAAAEGRWSTACAVGGAAEATVAATSSALVACEIPPREFSGDGAATASVALVSRDGGGRGTERRDAVATVAGSIPEETSNALWIEYLAPAVGGGAGMRPSRGPSWGGVRPCECARGTADGRSPRAIAARGVVSAPSPSPRGGPRRRRWSASRRRGVERRASWRLSSPPIGERTPSRRRRRRRARISGTCDSERKLVTEGRRRF